MSGSESDDHDDDEKVGESSYYRNHCLAGFDPKHELATFPLCRTVFQFVPLNFDGHKITVRGVASIYARMPVRTADI